MSTSILDAAYHVVHDYPGGAASLAPRMGKSSTTLSHEVTATGTAKFGLLDAVKVTSFSGDLRILQAWAIHAGQMLLPLPSDGEQSDECLAHVASSAKEFSELVAAAADSLADGRVSDNEMDRIEREAGELFAAVHGLIKSMRERNQADKPVHERRLADQKARSLK